MSKSYFWPIVLIVMGLIFLASNMGLLPKDFWNLWPVILIVVGLGGLVTADRKEWMKDDKSGKSSTKKKSR